MSDDDIKREWDSNYQDALACWSPYYDEAYTDIKFFVGDQWSAADKDFLRAENRNAYVFNNIRRIIKMVTGHQRRNRLSSVCQPVEGSDEASSEIFTDLLLWVMQRNDGYHQLSDAFQGALVSGMNLMSLWMDFREDPSNGDIKIGHEPYNSFLIDPYFTKIDLSDCRYVMRRRYVSPDEAKSLVPGKDKDIDSLNTGKVDDKFTYMVYARNNCDQDMVAYDEYWRRIHKKSDLLIDRVTGENRVWKGSPDSLKEFKLEFPWVESKKIWVPSVELNIFIQNELMFSGEDPYGLGDYPFVPVVAMWEPQYDDYAFKLQGLVRPLRDSQEELNRYRSRMSDILNSQANSGWIVTEGKVTNKADLFKTGQGVVIERTEDSQPSDLVKIPSPEVSQSLFLMVSELGKNIMEIIGGNEELLGVSDTGNTEISGTLAKVRAANGLTTIQDVFDNLSLSQKIMSGKIIKIIQENFTPEKVQRITNKKPTEEFYNKQFGKYDCVVKEGMLTDTQKQLAYAQALGARQVGIPIPDSFIIEMMPIANKEDLKKSFEAQAQQQAEQAQKEQEQEELIKKLSQTKMISDLSLAAERRSRMVADAGLAKERIAQAGYDRARTITEIMKTVSELEQSKVEVNDRRIIDLQLMIEMLREKDSMDVEQSQQQALAEVLATSQIAGAGFGEQNGSELPV